LSDPTPLLPLSQKHGEIHRKEFGSHLKGNFLFCPKRKKNSKELLGPPYNLKFAKHPVSLGGT
jgi:hypothetical protein